MSNVHWLHRIEVTQMGASHLELIAPSKMQHVHVFTMWHYGSSGLMISSLVVPFLTTHQVCHAVETGMQVHTM